jgi:hypothetical protein
MTRSLGLGVMGTVLQKKIVTSNTYVEYLAEGERLKSNILWQDCAAFRRISR